MERPPLSALYEELRSAMVGLAALHRAIATHPDARMGDAHRGAAEDLDNDIEWFCDRQGATYGR